jgi:hypothetical protein
LRRLVRRRALAVTLVLACCGLLGYAAANGSSAAIGSTVHVRLYGARASTRTSVLHLHRFRSPSGNIFCDIVEDDRAYCLTWTPPQSVGMDFHGKVRICSGSRKCTGPCLPGAHMPGCTYGNVPVLAYGQRDDVPLYSCVSRTTGVTCTVARGAAKGKGFRVAKAGITPVA